MVEVAKLIHSVQFTNYMICCRWVWCDHVQKLVNLFIVPSFVDAHVISSSDIHCSYLFEAAPITTCTCRMFYMHDALNNRYTKLSPSL